MTPNEFRKIFCIEALSIAGRLIAATFSLAAVAVWYMLKMSYLEVRGICCCFQVHFNQMCYNK
ncbi:hypothetical protein D3Z47_08715 [Lachnospiraceae bacterium]|nr:hypothetical protein [Lachnospiraceae bacterium]